MSILSLIKNLINERERAPTALELADMGLSRSSYQRLLSSADGTRQRMEVLAAQFNVTPEMIDADRGLALELAETCGHCKSAKACQNAIDLGVDFNTRHCPNATIYSDMAAP
ncbi:hypothetical protein OS190_19220 [Sulfitobacter sp. F26204]|uniref:hypothetical protein n=1 Tax=Sulfitobacter sp. F26204 TaxID=2996014 RepID=UPI00225E6D31|nr:hypothetical protein [Sulfitobacter sp. F26204]MCX7561698.1 hypothetical protein [Sulfitobacter sp. F26204]